MSNIPLYWTAMICDEPTQKPIVGAQVTIKTNAGDLETYSGYSTDPSGWVNLQGEGHTGVGNTIVLVDVNAEAQGFGKTTVKVGTFDANGFHWSINGLTNGIENTVWLRSRRGQSSSPLVTGETSIGFGALGTIPAAWRQFELASAGSASTNAGITAVSRIPNSMEVWWVGTDGSIQDAFWYEGGQWQRFELAPAGSASGNGGITTVSRIPNSMEVWWVGANGSVQDAFWYA